MAERTQYGKYTVVDKIGQGAMGEVLRAHDPVLDREVALKVIASSLESSADARQRFHREAQSIARLNHPNIVTVFDFGEEKGIVYMAMELLDGTDLRSLIAANRFGGLDPKLAVMEQVCAGVGYAHSRNVIHRDLKPANIQVLTTGHVKVMDFGLARIGAQSGMTATGAVLGTPHYMSPEQVKGEKADSRSDVFALGAILYQLLTGRQPFDAESVHAVLFRILEGEPEPVERWIDDVPAEVAGLVVRALAKDPDVRFGDAGEMTDALASVRASLPGGKTASDPATLATLLDNEAHQGATHILPTPSQGALALDALIDSGSNAREKTRQSAPTLHGKAPTRPGTSRPAPSQASASASTAEGGGVWVKAAAIAAAAVVGLGLVAWGVLRPGSEPAPAPTEQSGPTAIEQQLLAAERKLAQESLQDREFASAADHAEKALAIVADDPEALRVREAARQALDAAEGAAAGAREALAQGDTATAGRQLQQLLEVQPDHPAVTELTAALNDSFRPQAEDARSAMRRAEAQAGRQGASGQALAHANTLSREGTAAFSRSEFAVAAERFSSARDAYARAGRAAAARAEAAEAEAARVAAAEAEAARTRAAEEEAARQHAAQEAAARQRAAAEAAERQQAAQAAAAAASAPPPAPPTPAGPSDEELVRTLVADYGRAIENQDLNLFRQVKPNLSGAEESRLRQAFQGPPHEVNIQVNDVDLSGDSGRVRVVRRDRMNGNSLPPINQVLSVRKVSGRWVLESIGR